jgi:hypothetical protein
MFIHVAILWVFMEEFILKKHSIGLLILPRHYSICLKVIQSKRTQKTDSTLHFFTLKTSAIQFKLNFHMYTNLKLVIFKTKQDNKPIPYPTHILWIARFNSKTTTASFQDMVMVSLASPLYTKRYSLAGSMASNSWCLKSLGSHRSGVEDSSLLWCYTTFKTKVCSWGWWHYTHLKHSNDY